MRPTRIISPSDGSGAEDACDENAVSDVHRALLAENFHAFLRYAFGWFNSAPLSDQPYLESLCYLLERAVAGEYRRLAVNLPPRTSKSFALVCLQAWLLGRDPTVRIMAVTYGEDLARPHADRLREIISSAWYQDVFPLTRPASRGDRDLVIRTSAGGHCCWTTVRGAVTGLGGQFIMMDDVAKAQEIHWSTAREEVARFLNETLFNRFDNPATGVLISLQQRLHVADIVARLLEQPGFHHVVYPAIAIDDREYPLYHGRVWRRRAGDYLDPLRITPEFLEDTRARSPHTYAAQFQQAPELGSSAVINIHQVRFLPRSELPPPEHIGFIVQVWDTGASISEGRSWSVGLTLGWVYDRWFVLDQRRVRLHFPELLNLIRHQRAVWNADALLIENASSGQQIWQTLQRERAPGLQRWGVNQPKDVRFYAATALLTSERFAVTGDADWTPVFRHEIMAFPAGEFDDIPDTLSLFSEWAQSPACEAAMAEKFAGARVRPSRDGYDLAILYFDWLCNVQGIAGEIVQQLADAALDDDAGGSEQP